MLRIIFILFLIGTFLPCLAQKPTMGRAELFWSISHPIAAIKVKKITRRCYTVLDHKKINGELDNFSNGGKPDAFRHIFFMAAYTQKIKSKKIRKLGKAHERTNYRQFLRSKTEDGEMPDSMSTVMDLKNNELGFQLGAQYKKASLENLRDVVLNEIKSGKAIIMKRDPAGNYLDCKGKKIDLDRYKHSWYVPKCLVSSESK